MPRKAPRIPKYRRHATGQAFVQVKGERFYLGKYGTEESKEEYRRFIAELTTSPVPDSVTPRDRGVSDVLVVQCVLPTSFSPIITVIGLKGIVIFSNARKFST